MGHDLRLLARILRERLRSYRRFLSANAFVLFLLGPVILGGSWWVAGRYLELARGPLAARLAAAAGPGPVGLATALLVTALFLPATLRELFPRREELACLEPLPVSEGIRFHLALASCWAHLAPAWVVLLAALVALRGAVPPVLELAAWGLRLAAAFLILALLGMVAAQLRVRLARRAGVELAALFAAAALATGVAAAGGAGWPRWLLLPWWPAAAGIETVTAAALKIEIGGTAAAGSVAWTVTVAVLYAAAAAFSLAFRRRDLERAESLVRPSRSGPGGTFQRLAALARDPALGALVARDFLLVARRFSPAVYLAAALAVLCLAVVHLVLPGLDLPPLWRGRAVLLGSVVAVLCVVALVPLVLKHQLARLWIEKSTAVPPEKLWQAKVGLALGLALPGAAVAAALLAVSPGAPAGSLVVAALQILAGSLAVASTIGLGAYEIAAQPVLGLVFAAFVGLALAALFVLHPEVWWIWAVLWAWAAGKLAERATGQVRATEVGR